MARPHFERTVPSESSASGRCSSLLPAGAGAQEFLSGAFWRRVFLSKGSFIEKAIPTLHLIAWLLRYVFPQSEKTDTAFDIVGF